MPTLKARVDFLEMLINPPPAPVINLSFVEHGQGIKEPDNGIVFVVLPAVANVKFTNAKGLTCLA